MGRNRQAVACCVYLLVSGAAGSGNAVGQDVGTEATLAPASSESARGFTTVTSVRELADDRMLVADRGENRLYLLNWRTGKVDEVLRRGDGPREYRAIGWLYAVEGNRTLFTDYARRRWILMDGGEATQTFVESSPLNRRFRARLDGVAVSGAVLASVSAESPGNAIAEERVLELAPALGPHKNLPQLDTLGLVDGAGKDQLACVLGGVRGEPRCQFLESEEQAVLFPDGWIAVALLNPYRVDWRSPDGEWIRGEMLDGSIPVTGPERCAAITAWVEGKPWCESAAVSSYMWPATIPAFLTDSPSCRACQQLPGGVAPWLFADPHGHLVVRRTPHASERGNVYDVIDRAGRLIERLRLPHGEAIVGFGDSHVYTIRTDEYDLQWLRRHPWR